MRQFITAGAEDQTVPHESIFAHQYVRALEGDADTDGDGFLTGTELGTYVQDTVINYSRNAQTPHYRKIRDPNLAKGDFVFEVGASVSAPTETVVEEPESTGLRLGRQEPGNIDARTETPGDLYLDGEHMRRLYAREEATLYDVPAGMREVEMRYEDHVERLVGEDLSLSIGVLPGEGVSGTEHCPCS